MRREFREKKTGLGPVRAIILPPCEPGLVCPESWASPPPAPRRSGVLLAPLGVALHAAVGPHAVVGEVGPDGLGPAAVRPQRFVELRGNLAHLRQAVARDLREVVVLVVVADVVGDGVQGGRSRRRSPAPPGPP